MKKIIYLFVLVLVASACSGPKYTASFNSWDKPVNYQTAAKSETVVNQPITEPVAIAQPEQLLASTSNAPADVKAAPKKETINTYIQMTKTERKEVRTHLRSEIKSFVKEQKKNFGIESTKATGAWDNDLKLAAIFGAVGLIFTALWSSSEILGIIGVVAVVIALVFLIKWLARQ